VSPHHKNGAGPLSVARPRFQTELHVHPLAQKCSLGVLFTSTDGTEPVQITHLASGRPGLWQTTYLDSAQSSLTRQSNLLPMFSFLEWNGNQFLLGTMGGRTSQVLVTQFVQFTQFMQFVQFTQFMHCIEGGSL